MDDLKNPLPANAQKVAVLSKATIAIKKYVFTPGSIGALAAPGVVQLFVQEKRTDELISLLIALDGDARASVLAANESLWLLVISGRADDMVRILKTLSNDQQGKVLSNGNGLEALLKQGHVDTLLSIIKSLEPGYQAVLLSKKYIIERFFGQTNVLAGQIYDIIAKLSGEQQTRVLSVNYVISSLAKHGLALDVFNLIAHLDHNQKERIRIAKGYEEVRSFCSRRSTDRHPPLHAPKTGPVGLVSVTPLPATTADATDENC